MGRFGYTARGMLSGLLGAAVAALLAWTTFYTVASILGSPDEGANNWRQSWELLGLVLYLTIYTLPIWATVGLAAGIGLGRLVGARPVGRRVLIVAAVSGALLVTAVALPAVLIFPLPGLTAAIPAGLVGGMVAAAGYGRMVERLPTAVVQPEVVTVAVRSPRGRWPILALLYLLVGVAVPMILTMPVPLFGPLLLLIILPLMIGIGWFVNLLDALRPPTGIAPWAEWRRIGLALAGGLLVVGMLTGLSAVYPTEVAGRNVQPPVFTDSVGLPSNGWPTWWRVNVGQVEAARGWEYRPAAHSQNAGLWAILVVVTLLIEPVVGATAAELRHERR